MFGPITICLTLVIALLPDAMAVIFAKGRENRINNAFIETTNSNFQLECIKWHNYFRKLHGVQPLQYSPALAEFARRRAIQLATKDGTNFYHPDDLPYGENLAWNSQEPIDCSLPLKLWYDEWKIYNFQRPNINPRNGHFTQMVWKDSHRIGCAQAVSKGANGGTYTVCNYDPPGNFENEERENVSPAIGGQYYDFGQDSRYKQKKIKIYSTTNGHHTTTHTFQNGKYHAHNDHYIPINYGSQTVNQFPTYKKWYNFRPHTNTFNMNAFKQTSYNSLNNYRTSNSYGVSFGTYRPSITTNFGNSYKSYW
ncbi:hypothetical protein RDWZM_001130 [Blomia tropicalis]|uniref:SCP domain-containing protein n=1 Tax=Blomia tropicalis TaxID=40697 RepID=A0A9Q0MB19_BLOTA|nr:hypothetical protein RDWZM_001130 [Blomia tropicalis]